MPEGFTDDDSKASGAVGSTRHLSHLVVDDEAMDETSRTHHEPNEMQDSIESVVEESLPSDDEKLQKDPTNKDVGGPSAAPSASRNDPAADVNYRLHRKVAEIAANAYKRASAQSQVLSRSKLEDVGLVQFKELEIGEFLGKGSFSNVHEITKVTSCRAATGVEPTVKFADNATNVAEDRLTINTLAKMVSDPRELLTDHYQREGNADENGGTYRYAVKFLKEEIRSNPQKYAIGTADLVVEGMFLASLSHPNIIKVRGLPEGGVKSLTSGHWKNGYFLVLDRLFDTLSERIYTKWQKEHRIEVSRSLFGRKNKEEKEDRDRDLAARLKVAFDVCAALKFLHGKSIIYRDLKPENLGFDVRGDVKLFDLGLVKELHPSDRDKRGNYRLSMAGTPRYMAPECGMYQPYNLTADTYSFSMLLWEIVTLEKPLKDFTYSRLKNEVFIDGFRPSVKGVFNKKIRALINSGWSQNPSKRPGMDLVYDELREEYLRLSPGSVPEAQTSHNRRRSTFVSKRATGMLSVRHLMKLDSTESLKVEE